MRKQLPSSRPESEASQNSVGGKIWSRASERASEDISRLHLGMAFGPLPRRADDASLSAPRSWISADERARAAVHCQGQAAPPSLVVPISATRSRGPSGAIKSPIKTGEACPFITVRAPRPSVYPLGARQTADRQFAEICGCVPPTSSLRYSLSTRPLSKRLAMYCNLPPFRCGPMQSAHLLELGKNPRKKGH